MSQYLFTKAIRAFVLIAFVMGVSGTAEASSSKNSNNYPGTVSTMHGKFTVVAVSEAGDNPNAAQLAVHVAIEQAEVAGKPVEKVISSVAFQGPKNNPKPWTRKGGMKQFTQMAEVIKPLYTKWAAGNQDYLPDHLEKYKSAKHFDSRKHRDFGGFVVQFGNTCFYDGVKRKVQPKDTCTASYGKSNMIASKKRSGSKMKTDVASKKPVGNDKLVARKDSKPKKA